MTMRMGKGVGGTVVALVLSLSSAALTSACGGGGNQVRVSSPFTEEHAKYFEDGLDYVADPSSLEDRWRDQWQADMDRRIEFSDLIARVKVATVRSSWDLDRTMLQLDLAVKQLLRGEDPPQSIAVSVREGDVGYPSVKSNEARLLNADYIVFVKWYVNDLGRPVPHWHLAPDSDAVRALVAARVELLNTPATPPPRLSW